MSYDSDVVSATSGRGEPDWDKIIKLCNRIRDSIGTLSMAQAMGSVMRRVKHSDSNIQLHALTLLESCVSNCGPDFQLELTKSTFHSDVKSILTGPYTDQRVKQRVKELLGSWTTEFKSNSRMSPLIKFVEQLGREGVPPQPSPGANRQQPPPQQTPPAAIREDADLKKAIQLSLLETKATPPTSNLSLYPSVGSTPVPILKKKAARKVRAVYDFVAAEDNELSFRAGEVITIIDESDENWWKGETQLGKGLFPASFVSANLSVELQPSNVVESRKESQSSGGQKSKKTKKADKVAVVNEQKIDLFLDMIKGADVTSEENRAENETLLELEGECKKMKPLVDEKIAALQIQEDEMQEINKNFEEALVLYRKLLSEGPKLSSTVPQKQPVPQSQPGLPETNASYTQQPHNTHPTRPYNTHPPQATLPPQPHNTHPPQPHTTHHTQSYAVQPPPPYTTNSGALSGGAVYSQHQGGYTRDVPYGMTMGGAQPPPATNSQSYYAQPLDSVPSQMRSGVSPSASFSPNPQTAYQQQSSFYPQQQQTRMVHQPLL